MLFQVGGQGTRPTLFEMAAAQQLPVSLRAALTYSIGAIRVLTLSDMHDDIIQLGDEEISGLCSKLGIFYSPL
ncbi:hypothetical protein ACE6H2_022479 [Prunus campanulata]